MSSILRATCVGGVVSVQGIQVDAKILTSGVKDSEGFLILNGGDQPIYVTSHTSDIQKLITDLVDLVTSITTVLQSLDAVTTSPGGSAAGIAQITTKKISLNLTKDNLK